MVRITLITSSGSVSYRLDKNCITMGRAAGSDIQVEERVASRHHAELRRSDSSWQIVDLGSRHGTRHNGKLLTAPATLRPGDRIEIGRSQLLFEQPASEPDPAPEDHETAPEEGASETAAQVLVGSSAYMRALRDMLGSIAAAADPVLITGESGTGKDVVANLLHQLSPRAAQPFVVVNCPAIPGPLLEAELFGVERGVATGVEARIGKLELANGGTVFLDEIGDLELSAQARLLRVLQDSIVERLGGRRPIHLDVRFLAATNHDLEADVAAGRFRRDLYHRINVLPVELPSLRERPEDIPLLVEHFLLQSAPPRPTISADAMEALRRHDYPGNVRELRNLVRRLCRLAGGSVVGAQQLPEKLRQSRAASSQAPAPSGNGAEGRSRSESLEATERMTRLLERIVVHGESFWSLVREPFLRHDLGREELRLFVRLAHARGGRSYLGMAKLLGLDQDYRRLLDFLRNHGLRLRDGE